MAKERQPRYSSLPHNLYMQVIYMIRDYDRMKAEYASIVEESPLPPDGMPRGSGRSDPTGEKAVRLEELGRKLRAVESGRDLVPEEYRRSLWNNIVYRIPYDIRHTSYQTYGYWKHKMVMRIAADLNIWKQV